MIRFIHLADLHLDAKPSFLGNLAAQRNQDFLDAFKRVVDYALEAENGINAIIIAGDLFDSPSPDQTSLNFAIAQIKRLYEKAIPVVLVPGNHDALGRPGSIYADPKGEIRRLVGFIDSPNVERAFSIPLNGELTHFYGMAWDVTKSRPPFDEFRANEESGHHVAILHATLDVAQFIGSHSRDVPLRLSALANTGMDYIALGHIHSPQLHAAGTIPVVYPGNLEAKRLTAGEEGERNLVIVSLESGQAPIIERVPWNAKTTCRKSIDLNQETVESTEDLAALIRARFGHTNLLLRLELHGSIPFLLDIDELQTRLSGDFYWLSIKDHTDVFDSRLIQDWAHEQTIRGLFVRKMLIMKEESSSDQELAKIEQAMKLTIQALQNSIKR